MPLHHSELPGTPVSVQSVRIKDGQVRVHFTRVHRGHQVETILLLNQTDADVTGVAMKRCADQLRDPYARTSGRPRDASKQ